MRLLNTINGAEINNKNFRSNKDDERSKILEKV